MLGKGSTGEFDREGKGREGVPPHERGLGGQKRGEASALTPGGGGGGTWVLNVYPLPSGQPERKQRI